MLLSCWGAAPVLAGLLSVLYIYIYTVYINTHLWQLFQLGAWAETICTKASWCTNASAQWQLAEAGASGTALTRWGWGCQALVGRSWYKSQPPMHREKGPGELFDYFVIFESFSGSGFSCRLHLRVFFARSQRFRNARAWQGHDGHDGRLKASLSNMSILYYLDSRPGQ